MRVPNALEVLWGQMTIEEQDAFLRQRLRLISTARLAAILRSASQGQVRELVTMLSHRLTERGS